MNFYYANRDDQLDNVLRNAGASIRGIVRLCEVMGAPQAARLQAWLDALPPNLGDEEYLLRRAQIDSLLAALEGIPEAAKAELTDDKWRLRPEAAERLAREAPELVSTDDLGQGVRVPTLNGPLGDVYGLRGYLRRAIKLDTDISIA